MGLGRGMKSDSAHRGCYRVSAIVADGRGIVENELAAVERVVGGDRVGWRAAAGGPLWMAADGEGSEVQVVE
jgi:hypothetical protein